MSLCTLKGDSLHTVHPELRATLVMMFVIVSSRGRSITLGSVNGPLLHLDIASTLSFNSKYGFTTLGEEG